MVLGKLPVPGCLLNWIVVGQGPTAFTVGAGGGCLDIFSLVYHFSFLSPTLWERAPYRLKYCLKRGCPKAVGSSVGLSQLFRERIIPLFAELHKVV